MVTQTPNPDIESARSTLVMQTYGRCVRQLSVLALEIAMESGPYRSAARALATSADRIRDNIVRMSDAARLLSDVGDPVDPALLELRQLSGRLHQEIIVPLREASALNEASAASAFRRVGERASSILDDCEARLAGTSVQTKVIASLDVARYSSLASRLHENLGVEAVSAFNEEIENLVRQSLRKTAATAEESSIEMTADGAILAFNNSEQAHRFAETLHKLAQEANHARDVNSQLHFRIGISSGEVLMERPVGLSGAPISEAIRLESASKTGEALMSVSAWKQLPANVQALYGGEELIAGKRRERMAARRCRFLPAELVHTED